MCCFEMYDDDIFDTYDTSKVCLLVRTAAMHHVNYDDDNLGAKMDLNLIIRCKTALS